MQLVRSAFDAGLSHFPDDGAALVPARLGSSTTDAIGAAAGTSVLGPGVGTAVGTEAAHLVAGLFGGTGKYGTVQSEGAEQARIDAAELGISKGSVEAGQYLLGQAQSDTSNYAKQATANAVNRMQVAYPDIMAQAEAAGLKHDTADGYGVLSILLNLGVPFSETYAGYDTTTTQPGSPETRAIVEKLRTLTPFSTLTNAAQASVTIPGTTQKVPIVLLLGIGIAAYMAVNKAKRRA